MRIVGRWKLLSSDGHTYYDVVRDQCRTFTHIVRANTFRLLMAAARTLWFIVTSEQHADIALQWLRPEATKLMARGD